MQSYLMEDNQTIKVLRVFTYAMLRIKKNNCYEVVKMSDSRNCANATTPLQSASSSSSNYQGTSQGISVEDIKSNTVHLIKAHVAGDAVDTDSGTYNDEIEYDTSYAESIKRTLDKEPTQDTDGDEEAPLMFQNLPKLYSTLANRILNNAFFGHLAIGARNRNSKPFLANTLLNTTFGLKLSFTKIWPAVFYALLINDLIAYANEDERYGNTIGKILAGTSTNQNTLTSHFGSDKVDTFAFNLPYLAIAAPVLFSLIGGMTSNIIDCCLSSNEQTILTNFEDAESVEDAIQELKNLLLRGSLLGKLVAMNSIRKMADYLSEDNIARIEVSDETKAEMKLRRDRFVNMLPDRKVIGEYHRWSLGKHKSVFSNIFWIPTAIYLAAVVFADARLLELLIKSTLGHVKYHQEKNSCENENHNDYLYLPQIQNYSCVPCGTWEGISYRDMQTSQGCINGLFASAQNPQYLADKINELEVTRDDIKHIDFTKQAWISWNDTDFSNVLTALKKVSPTTIESIRFSGDEKNNKQIPSTVKINHIVEFNQDVSSKSIEFSNINLGANNTVAIADGLRNNTVIESFVLRNANASDTGITAVANAIQTLPNLKLIDIANNGALNTSIPVLAQRVEQHPVLQDFIVAGNQISTENMNVLMTGVANSPVKNIDVSGIPFTPEIVSHIANEFQNSSLSTLTANNCAMTGDMYYTLAPMAKNVVKYVTQHNPLNDDDFNAAANILQDGNLLHIDVTSCSLSDYSATGASRLISNSKLNTIILSGNEYTDAGSKKIIESIPESSLQRIALNDMELPETPAYIVEIYSNNTSIPVKHWELRNIGMDTERGARLFEELRGLVSIDVGANQHLNDSLPMDVMIRNNKNILEKVIIDRTSIGSNVMTELTTELPGSAVKEIIVSHNSDIQGYNFNSFAQALIYQPNGYNINDLGDKSISRDKTRALVDSNPRTNLSRFEGDGINMTTTDRLSLCRVSYPAHLDVRFDGNNPCMSSAATRNQIPGIFRLLSDVRQSVSGYLFSNQKMLRDTPRVSHTYTSSNGTVVENNSHRHASPQNTTSPILSSTALNVMAVGGVAVGLLVLTYWLYHSNSDKNTNCRPSRNLKQKRYFHKQNQLNGIGLFQASSKQQHHKRQEKFNCATKSNAYSQKTRTR